MRKADNTHDITGLIYKGTEWSDDPKYQTDIPIEELEGYSMAELGVVRQGQLEREWDYKPSIEIKVIMDSLDRKRILIETETRNSKVDAWQHSGLYTSKSDIWYIEFYNLNKTRESILLTTKDLWRLRSVDGVEEINGNGIFVAATGQYKRGYSIPYDSLMIYLKDKFGFSNMEIDRNESRTEYNKL